MEFRSCDLLAQVKWRGAVAVASASPQPKLSDVFQSIQPRRLFVCKCSRNPTLPHDSNPLLGPLDRCLGLVASSNVLRATRAHTPSLVRSVTFIRSALFPPFERSVHLQHSIESDIYDKMNIDPLTNKPLPANAIQRILYIAQKVHVYQIPPATSTKGYQASSWTANNNKLQIFTARLRIVETSIPSDTEDGDEKVTTTLLLEDPKSGDLFAAAPYTSERIVEQALDSSRFFAITVVGEGRKAVLGMGFEERSEAFDFSIALQDSRRVLGFEANPAGSAGPGARGAKAKADVEEPKRDFSLKEGETISINLGGLKGRRSRPESDHSPEQQKSEQDALFSIKPPPGSGGGFLPPPPSTKSVKEERRRSRQNFEPPKQTAEDLGFDDGEFGEFQ
jgi:hypothetical protein